MNTKSLANVDETEAVEGFEQTFSFKIGEEGYTYESCLERDCEGNITESTGYGILADKTNWDTEDKIAYVINTDADVWYDLDQQVYDAGVDETFIYYVDVEEFLKNNMFEEEEIEFIKEHEEKGYMKVYITVTENTILEEE